MSETHSLLVTSTAHVTAQEGKILTDSVYSRGQYGWFLYIGEHGDPAVTEVEQPSDGLLEVIRHARDSGCQYVLLDCDGDPLAGVTTYDW